jgi:hypothetical protein
MAACRSDPCGIICIIITYSAVFYADYVVIWHLVIPAMSNTYVLSEVFSEDSINFWLQPPNCPKTKTISGRRDRMVVGLTTTCAYYH